MGGFDIELSVRHRDMEILTFIAALLQRILTDSLASRRAVACRPVEVDGGLTHKDHRGGGASSPKCTLLLLFPAVPC